LALGVLRLLFFVFARLTFFSLLVAASFLRLSLVDLFGALVVASPLDAASELKSHNKPISDHQRKPGKNNNNNKNCENNKEKIRNKK